MPCTIGVSGDTGTLWVMRIAASIPATRSESPTGDNPTPQAGFGDFDECDRASRSHRSSHRTCDEPAHSHASTRMLCASVLVLIVLLIHAYASMPVAHAVGTQQIRVVHRHAAPCASPHTTPDQAIACVWPRNLRAKARRVAECESTASTSERVARRRHLGRWAQDKVSGSHWGIFQEGERERHDHGEYQLGSPALVQVKSAYDLYTDRHWSPWEASRHCWGRS